MRFMLLITTFWLLVSFAKAQNTCYIVENFQSTCIASTPNRQFNISFLLKAHPSAIAANQNQPIFNAVIQPTSGGTINGAPNLTIAFQNNQASVSFTFQEQTFNPSVSFMIILFKSPNNPLCRFLSTFTLAQCASNCNDYTGSYNILGAGPMYGENMLSAYPGALLSLVGTLSVSHSNDVQSVTYEILNPKRRSLCPNAISDWFPTLLVPLFNQHNQQPNNFYQWSLQSARYNFGGPYPFKNNTEQGVMLYLGNKLAANCAEEYSFDLKVTIEFSNGCLKEITLPNLTAKRP